MKTPRKIITTRKKNKNTKDPTTALYVFHSTPQNSILIFKGCTGNVNVYSYMFFQACAHPYSSSDVTSLKSGPKLDPVNTDDLDEGTEQHPSTTDRPSEHRHRQRHHNSSRGRPSSRGSSSGASDDTDDSRAIPKKGLFSQHSSQRDRHYSRNRSRSRSPSHSESRAQPESRHRGRSRSSSPGGNHSSKYSRSRKPSGKRKRSTSREERKRRKHKEKEREKDRETSREKKKRDEERRSVLTGKKVCPPLP